MGDTSSYAAVQDVAVVSEQNSRFRKTMEDSHVIIDKFGNDPTVAYFGVYDGHGGRAAVEFIEKHLHTYLQKELFQNQKAVPEALKQAYLTTDSEIFNNQNYNSGATCVSVLLRKENGVKKIYVANCGDARAVLNRNGKAQRLSYDHKGSDESEMKRVTDAGGFIVLNRVNGILAVTRSLGDHSLKNYVIGEPYLNEVELQPTDTFMIVACDGLWDVVSDQDAVKIVLGLGTHKAQSAAKALLEHALKNGSTDNITVLVVFF